MNAHTDLSRDLRERLLAIHILDNASNIPDPEDLYSREKWIEAARCAVDSDDYSELEFMARRAAVYADWCSLSERLQDDWCGFANFAAKWPASAGYDGRDFDAGARHPDHPGGW